MFTSGTAEINGRSAKLVIEVAKALKNSTNKLAVRGHTDSTGFGNNPMRNNWGLSAERADATRQLMESAGISPKRFDRIEGVADSDPKVAGNPNDPRNRRISITVLDP